MFWVAIVGLVGNVITAFLLFSESKQNLNIRSAFILLLLVILFFFSFYYNSQLDNNQV